MKLHSFLLPLITIWPAAAFEAIKFVLYEGKTDSVIELDGERFQRVILEDRTGTSWIVTHYAHWCGHCVHFAPEFIRLAESYRANSLVRFAAIDCALKDRSTFAERDVCNENDVRAYPTILHFRDGVRVGEIPKGMEELKQFVLELTNQALSTPVPLPSMSSRIDKAVFSFGYQAVVGDAAQTFNTLLLREVFRGNQEILGKTEFGDLQRLLALCLSLRLPSDTVDTCSKLRLEMKHRRGLTKVEWKDLLKARGINESVVEEPFRSCKDFSCGMWRLLHLITLSVQEDRSLLRSGEGQALSGQRAMDSIRFVVDKYFSCELCRGNFLEHFDSCDLDRCSQTPDSITVPSWLIRLHNEVNRRLEKPLWPVEANLSEIANLNALRAMYGMDMLPVSPTALSAKSVTLLFIMLLIAGFSVARFLSTRVFTKIKIKLTKKYQPIHIV